MPAVIAQRAKDHSEGAKRSEAPRSLHSASVKNNQPPPHWKALLSNGVGVDKKKSGFWLP